MYKQASVPAKSRGGHSLNGPLNQYILMVEIY
jgi:hypothetical protein